MTASPCPTLAAITPSGRCPNPTADAGSLPPLPAPSSSPTCKRMHHSSSAPSLRPALPLPPTWKGLQLQVRKVVTSLACWEALEGVPSSYSTPPSTIILGMAMEPPGK